MKNNFFEATTFNNIIAAQTPLAKGEYEQCQFINCDFSGSDFDEIKFTDCDFTGCNISNTRLRKTALRSVCFSNCKMMGLHFEDCNDFLFSVSFRGCNLSYSSFYQIKLKKTLFKDVKFQEADFTGCDLNEATFDNCDLTGAKFENTNLEKTDFRTSFNYSIDPEINRIKKAKFSIPAVTGLLDKYNIEIS